MEPLIWICAIGVSVVALRGIRAASEHRISADAGGSAGSIRADEPDHDGTWIELDVEPLFRSSERPPTIVSDLIADRQTDRP